MNNYLQPGDTVTLTAPSGGVVSGTGYKIGQLFVVAKNTVAATLPFEGKTTGVHTLPKTTGTAWTEGALLYWDDSTDKATTVAEDNLLIGCAVEAADSGDTTGTVRLNGIARTSGSVADDAVDTDAILDLAVTTAKIDDLAVTEGKLAANAVTAGKLADDAVDTGAILDDAVTTAKILDANVTEAKLAAALLSASADTTIYDHSDDVGANEVIAAATIDRVVMVTAKVTETLAGSSTSPSFKVGHSGGVADFLDVTAGSGDDVFFGTGTLPSGSALNVTVADGTGGSEAGKVQISILATPTATA
jgi:predicted RecA/RadA family phage recombinase